MINRERADGDIMVMCSIGTFTVEMCNEVELI